MTSGTDTAAVITDIHGNLPALEAALACIDELGIERIYQLVRGEAADALPDGAGSALPEAEVQEASGLLERVR